MLSDKWKLSNHKVEDYNFFSYCMLRRSTSRGVRKRKEAGERIAKQLGEDMPDWVEKDMLALHVYACHLGGIAVHEMVALAKEGGDELYEEASDALGALLSGERLAFDGFSSAARALAGWSLGGK